MTGFEAGDRVRIKQNYPSRYGNRPVGPADLAIRGLTGTVTGIVGKWLEVDLDDQTYRRGMLFVPRELEPFGRG